MSVDEDRPVQNNCYTCGDKLPLGATIHDCWLTERFRDVEILPDAEKTPASEVGSEDIVAFNKLNERAPQEPQIFF